MNNTYSINKFLSSFSVEPRYRDGFWGTDTKSFHYFIISGSLYIFHKDEYPEISSSAMCEANQYIFFLTNQLSLRLYETN